MIRYNRLVVICFLLIGSVLLKFERGMLDVKAIVQPLLEGSFDLFDAIPIRLRYYDMRLDRGVMLIEMSNVYMMHRLHAFNLVHRLNQAVKIDVGRHPVHQDVDRAFQ